MVTDLYTVQYGDLGADPAILAAKGCGAMGADVLLLIVERKARDLTHSHLVAEGWTVLASSYNLYRESALLKNSHHEVLEILP